MTSTEPKHVEETFEWSMLEGQTSKTWYTIYGDLSSSIIPSVILHGGPGMPHEHMLSLVDLNTEHGIPLIFYDQIGCGKSSHYPERKNDASFWTTDLFVAELNALIKHLGLSRYNVVGHSWGGMLAAAFATKQPTGLEKLVIGSGAANMQTWYRVQQELCSKLPQETREILEKGIAERNFDSKEYEQANDFYYSRHLYRREKYPQEVMTAFTSMMQDPTVMQTLNGPCEFLPLGTLSTFNIVEDIPKIKATTLLLNGRHDQAQDEVVLPYFQGIPRVKWMQFAESAHLWLYEERERATKVISEFLLNE